MVGNAVRLLDYLVLPAHLFPPSGMLDLLSKSNKKAQLNYADGKEIQTTVFSMMI